MGLSIGLAILFQRRHYSGGLAEIAELLDERVVARDDKYLEISATGAADEPRITLQIETDPERLDALIAAVTNAAREELHPAIARCDAMLVALWDRRHDMADAASEVAYLEPRLRGILYYANIREASEGCFPPDAGVAALVPIDDAALAKRLHGTWRLDPDAPCHVATPGKTGLTITPSGDLVYSMVDAGTTRRILLTYTVENGELVTDQPSKPGVRRTPISLDDDTLYLRDLGGPCTFVRDVDPLDPDAALAALVGCALRHGVASATPGGAMPPFVAIESPAGDRNFIRFADAAPASQTARATAEGAVRGTDAALYAYATDAVLTIGGERIEAIVVEGGRRGRAGAVMAAMRYGAGADGLQIALPDAPRSWL